MYNHLPYGKEVAAINLSIFITQTVEFISFWYCVAVMCSVLISAFFIPEILPLQEARGQVALLCAGSVLTAAVVLLIILERLAKRCEAKIKLWVNEEMS
jgi:hypothetical protein